MADEQPQECPCKNTVTDGEKGVLNFGLTKDMLKNPNAAAIGIARQLGGKNGDRLAGLINSANDPLTGLTEALPALTRIQNAVNSQKTIVNAFENECNKFTTVRGLTSIISSLGLYADLACALGIDGFAVSLEGNPVQDHGDSPHNKATMIQGNPNFVIGGRPVCTTASQASCGHTPTGSSTFFVG